VIELPFRFSDYETCCWVPITLAGGFEYFPHAQILMVGVAIGDADPIIAPNILSTGASGQYREVSWGRFDYHIYKQHEDTSFKSEDWIDAMALAYFLGFPPSLNGFATAIGVENKKDARGTRLINQYCVPQEDGTFKDLDANPEDKAAFEEYCLQDVRLLQTAWKTLSPIYPEWEKTQRANLEIVERMNERGVPIDRIAAIRAIKQIKEQETALREECIELTGFNPTQTEKLRVFLDVPNMTKATLESEEFTDPIAERVRDIRLAVSKAATKKLKPMIAMSETDGRARGCFIPNGAATGRGSSRGIQLQNLKRRVIDPSYFDTLHNGDALEDPLTQTQENIRGFLRAEKGNTFLCADYGQIEARILAWIAREKTLVSAFRKGIDVYKLMAANIFGISSVDDVTDDQRQLGKIGVLGCGFGASGPGIAAQAKNFGVNVDDDFGWRVVGTYRQTFPAIAHLWGELDKGVIEVVEGSRPFFNAARTTFQMQRRFLIATLPSGRRLRYYDARVEDGPRGRGVVFKGRVGMSLVDKRLWHGHLVENLCQAIAADIKLSAMKRCPFPLIAEVHDELVCEVPESDAERDLDSLIDVMCEVDDWMMSKLIVADGWVGERYSK